MWIDCECGEGRYFRPMHLMKYPRGTYDCCKNCQGVHKRLDALIEEGRQAAIARHNEERS